MSKGHDRAFTDRYTLGELLGTGGMGRVYAGRDSLLGRDVAIKIPRASLPPKSGSFIIDEARATAGLHSEHFARVLDAGTVESQGAVSVPYIVMERLSGTDLERILEQQGRLSPSLTIDYVHQACEALAEAHAAGIAHRDVKPANLFLARRPDGSHVVKVLDFGVANTIDTDGPTFVGTPHYIAPECIGGQRGNARSDVWSLGIVLYELITGKPPFAGTSIAAVCYEILNEQVQRLDAIDCSVSAALADVVERCLSKTPEARYANASELGQALGALKRQSSLSGISVPPPPIVKETPVWMSVTFASAAVVLAIVSTVFVHGVASHAAAASSMGVETKMLVASSSLSEMTTGHAKLAPKARR